MKASSYFLLAILTLATKEWLSVILGPDDAKTFLKGLTLILGWCCFAVTLLTLLIQMVNLMLFQRSIGIGWVTWLSTAVIVGFSGSLGVPENDPCTLPLFGTALTCLALAILDHRKMPPPTHFDF